jgi:small conductance mechanosensitive channel
MFMQDMAEILIAIFQNPFTQIALTLAVAIVVQIIFRRTIERIVHKIVRGHRYASPVDAEKREHTLTTIFKTASAVVIWTTVIILILLHLNVNIAALMTGAGILGIIVGLGAQSAIRNFVAGLFIIAENQYRVGDIVTLTIAGKDISGVVEDITVRITRLRDLDGNLYTVQNGEVTIVSNSSFGYANVNIDINVVYDTNVDKVEQIMNHVGKDMATDTKWAPHIFEPIQFFRVDGFGDTGVRVKALGKVEPAMQWELAGEYRRRLKKAFEKAGIEIPHPQQVISTYNQNASTPQK